MIHIQDPVIKSYSLHEALLESCDGALAGGGAFAWITRGGIDLFLRDKTFLPLIQDGSFELIIGTDAITTPIALSALHSLQVENKGLKALAFHNDVEKSIFHPKYCWFKKKTGGVAIVGSGNLTTYGLRKNWEVFAVLNLNDEEFGLLEKDWSNWTRQQADRLKSVNDSVVIERAKSNVKKWQAAKKSINKIEAADIVEKALESIEDETDDASAWQFSDDDSVLISEIPRASNRWNQANFHKHLFPNYFGINPSAKMQQRVLLRSVLSEGRLDEVESRPFVSVKSKNYRIELKAASGLSYPKKGRPIVVLIRVSVRMFIYQLVMPKDSSYEDLDRLLARFRTHSNKVRETITVVRDLKAACPNLTCWALDPT